MKFFKCNAEIYAFDSDGSQDHLVTPSMIEVTPEEASAYVARELPPINSVTMRQARLALLGAGKLSAVEAAINSLPEQQRTEAQIEWDYSSEVHRDKAFVRTLGAMLGLDDAAMDDLFVAAAAL